MPSPTWCDRPETSPLAASIAAAVHVAWDGPEEGASNRFADALRKAVGPETYAEVEMKALHLFHLQPRPPAGLEVPPPWAWFQICPRCQLLRQTKFTAAQNGRLKLEVLRDPDWIQGHFDQGRSTAWIAERLDCSPSLVVDWCAKHGILPPRTMAAREFDAAVRQLHLEDEGPGKIARELQTTTQHVRDSLRRQDLANRKSGHVYFEAEWWRERLINRGIPKAKAAKEAGIKPHAANYYVNRFGLSHITKRNAKRGRPRKYPELHDKVQLYRLLMDHEDSYAAVAEHLGCAASLVSRQARKLLGRDRKWQPVPHGKRSWWEERVDRGDTTWEMAEEAGIEEKSAREKLRLLDLLTPAYHNNAERERERRREKRSA